MRGSLNFCSRFFSFVALALATFFLRPHTLTLAVYRTLNLVPHERNFLIDTRSDTLYTCGLTERHTRAMLRGMCRTPRGSLQATTADHNFDPPSLTQLVPSFALTHSRSVLT